MKSPAPTRSRGRPKLSTEQETVPVTIRLTVPQKEKLAMLGGAPWVRDRIDKAKPKKE